MHILVVDDDAAVAGSLETVLTSAGHRVATAANAERARRLAHPGVDLVLTDLAMPGDDGLALAESLRRRHPRLPVALITAHHTAGTALWARSHGCIDALAKPVDLDRLLELVDRVDRLDPQDLLPEPVDPRASTEALPQAEPSLPPERSQPPRPGVPPAPATVRRIRRRPPRRRLSLESRIGLICLGVALVSLVITVILRLAGWQAELAIG